MVYAIRALIHVICYNLCRDGSASQTDQSLVIVACAADGSRVAGAATTEDTEQVGDWRALNSEHRVVDGKGQA